MEHSIPILPTVNAFLNSMATIFLIGGAYSIKQRKIDQHKKFMVAAMISSGIFLTCYVLNKILVGGLTRYQGQGLSRTIYFIILGTHTPLAMIILPFSIAAVWRALHENYTGHVAITRWLLPVWLYVSVTGVIIYIMLYVL